MNIRSILVIASVSFASAVSANGGLALDNVNQHMNSQAWVQTNSVAPVINAQGSIDAFTQYQSENQSVVDSDSLQQSYDGQS